MLRTVSHATVLRSGTFTGVGVRSDANLLMMYIPSSDSGRAGSMRHFHHRKLLDSSNVWKYIILQNTEAGSISQKLN
jgi:hypothetical protein